MMSFIKKISGERNNADCCGVVIKEVQETDSKNEPCCKATNEENNESCCA